MSLHVQGDTGFLIELEGALGSDLLARVRGLAAALRADLLGGVTEIVPSFGCIGVSYEPERVPTPKGELAWRVVGEWIERHLATAPSARRTGKPREHLVPVLYGGEGGPDLEAVAKATKLSVEAVVKLHSGAVYEVAAIGFSPGFPYLLGLPAQLAMPRRATPRAKVAAGSVGIGAKQTGIYPGETPGGWQLIGRTSLTIFDPRMPEPANFAAGDRVRFKAVPSLPETESKKPVARVDATEGKRREERGDTGAGMIEVLKPGTLTTVQGPRRRGLAHYGIAGGGSLDPWAAEAANLAAGNPSDAAVLECTYVGPILRFHSASTVVVLGGEVSGVVTGRPLALAAGDVLDLTRLTRGARVYLAVAGGLRVESILGSVATAVGARFGGHDGRALVAGDQLAIGLVGSGRIGGGANWKVYPPVAVPGRKDTIEVRLVPGPDWGMFFRRHRTDAAVVLAGRSFRLSAKSDRMGLRLSGEPLLVTAGASERWSRPVVPGTVQVPPDGQPIVMMAEGQTIGGYLQLGQVASIDLPKLVQARPGAEIVFRVVDLSEAQGARVKVASEMARLRVGLSMLR